MQLPKEVVKAVAEAKHLVIFTGAGVSAESGMPTFRDALTGLLSIGTSGVVQPAAQLPVLAVEVGAWVAHINPEAIDVEGSKEFSLVGKAGSLLPQLLKQVEAWQAF